MLVNGLSKGYLLNFMLSIWNLFRIRPQKKITDLEKKDKESLLIQSLKEERDQLQKTRNEH